MKTSDLVNELVAIDPEGVLDLRMIDASTGDIVEPDQIVKALDIIEGNSAVVWMSLAAKVDQS